MRLFSVHLESKRNILKSEMEFKIRIECVPASNAVRELTANVFYACVSERRAKNSGSNNPDLKVCMFLMALMVGT